ELLGKLAQQFQVLAGGFFGYHQSKNEIYRLVVDGIEVNRLRECHEHANDPVQTLQPAMGNGNAFTNTRAAQAFPGNQVVEDVCIAQSFILLVNLLSDKLQNPFLAGCRNSAQRELRSQNVVDSQGCV